MASRGKKHILEEYEWTDFWWDNRDVDVKKLLMIGDSQTKGMRPYFAAERSDLRIDMMATSKCIDNPDYTRELIYMLENYQYDVIIFSHGLHGWHLGVDEYKSSCQKVLDYLKETKAKIIVESCLPVAVPGNDFILDDTRNTIVNERNNILEEVSRLMNVEYVDLYSEVLDREDIRDRDGMHYNEKGYKYLSHLLAERI